MDSLLAYVRAKVEQSRGEDPLSPHRSEEVQVCMGVYTCVCVSRLLSTPHAFWGLTRAGGRRAQWIT